MPTGVPGVPACYTVTLPAEIPAVTPQQTPSAYKAAVAAANRLAHPQGPSPPPLICGTVENEKRIPNKVSSFSMPDAAGLNSGNAPPCRDRRTHADIIRLFFGQAGQLHAQIVQMQARHLFVKMLGQAVNAHFELLLPKFHLRQTLVREGVRHHEPRDGP